MLSQRYVAVLPWRLPRIFRALQLIALGSRESALSFFHLGVDLAALAELLHISIVGTGGILTGRFI